MTFRFFRTVFERGKRKRETFSYIGTSTPPLEIEVDTIKVIRDDAPVNIRINRSKSFANIWEAVFRPLILCPYPRHAGLETCGNLWKLTRLSPCNRVVGNGC